MMLLLLLLILTMRPKWSFHGFLLIEDGLFLHRMWLQEDHLIFNDGLIQQERFTECLGVLEVNYGKATFQYNGANFTAFGE